MDFKSEDMLHLRYRPTNLDELIGNKPVKDVIKGCIKSRKLIKLFLFSGMPGSGKTSLARITGRTINCQNLKPGEYIACGKCDSCQYTVEHHPDVIEMNMSENGGKEEVLKVISHSKYNARYNFKVIILDEIQGASAAAKQALLKPTEEPSPRTVWIMCTTAPETVPPALLSRSSVHNLQYPDVDNVARHLLKISKKEFNPKVISGLKGYYVRIAKTSNCQIRQSLILLENVAKALEGMPKSKAGDVIREQISNLGNLQPIVMKFLLQLYTNKIPEALSVIGTIENNKVAEFISLVCSYSHYASIYIANRGLNKSVGRGFRDVSREIWESHLDKQFISKKYLIPLRVSKASINATEKLRRGLIAINQVLLTLIYDFVEG